MKIRKDWFLAGGILGVAVAAIAALGNVPTRIDTVNVERIFISAWPQKGYVVIVRDPLTNELTQRGIEKAKIYADLPPNKVMYAKIVTQCGGTCPENEIHVHGAQNLAGGTWEEHDYLNMHREQHRLATIE